MLMPHHLQPNMPATSTSAYSLRHQQHSLEHSHTVKNSLPYRVSHRHLSRTIYLAPLPLTMDTCPDIDQTLPPQDTITTTLSLHVRRSITCSPNTKCAPCKMYFALPHWPTPSLAQSTPTSLVHSLFTNSKVCSIFLLHMSTISMQSYFAPCPLAQMHPW